MSLSNYLLLIGYVCQAPMQPSAERTNKQQECINSVSRCAPPKSDKQTAGTIALLYQPT